MLINRPYLAAIFSVLAVFGCIFYLQRDFPPLMQSFVNAEQSGTTLTVTKTAAGHKIRLFNWFIEKTADPVAVDLFRGDDTTVQYTVSLTKGPGIDRAVVEGEICVNNGGAKRTENLTIVDEIQYKVGSGKYMELVAVNVDTSVRPVLNPYESYCYPYTIEFDAIEGANYRNVAHVTIDNHSGWLPGGNNCPGTTPCPFGPSPKTDFTLPTLPDRTVNDEVTVTDGAHEWMFSASGEQTYSVNYHCDEDDGAQHNTATIEETGQSASATVHISCHELQVTKTAGTSYKRQYAWDIQKEADHGSLLLSEGQMFPLWYSVIVSSTGYTDSNFAVAGEINIHNPSPLIATLANVVDTLMGPVVATVDCPALTVGPGQIITCTYHADLPDATNRLNTAVAVLQNNNGGTTSFSGEATANFANAEIELVDDTVTVTDSFAGYLGTVSATHSDVTKMFRYVRDIGPYGACGTYPSIENTATFETNHTGTTGSASRTVPVRVPCEGCTLTIGYWKNHAGLGPQADMLSQYLPIWLGTPSATASVLVTSATQAVDILSMRKDAQNGINRLAAQLLAAKLNIANGASSTAIADTIEDADEYLAEYDHETDWKKLDKKIQRKIIALMNELDDYNNGLIGSGHCTE